MIRNHMWREQKQLEIYVAQHDTMVQPQEQIGPVSNTVQAGYIFPWQLTPSDGVDFLAKKKIFDEVMHIRRLEEEVMILATEVRQHWEFLKRREQTLSGLSISTEATAASLKKDFEVFRQSSTEGGLSCSLTLSLLEINTCKW